MGFGLLFIGYFMTYLMSFNSFGFLFRMVGYFLILLSTAKLCEYNKSFLLPKYASLVMLIGSAFESLLFLLKFLYDNLIIDFNFEFELVKSVYQHIDSIFILIFHAFLLYSIRQISVETESEKTAYAAARNFVFLCIYYAMSYASLLPFGFVGEYVKYFSLPVFLLYLVCIVLNLVLIFTCYAKICDENDVEMKVKESRFKFVNKLREESERREEKAKESTAKYVEERIRARQIKKNKRK